MSLSEDHSYDPERVTEDGAPVYRNPDASSMRGVAHPLRLRILEILRMEGPATATTLAERLGVRTGSTSWHLQKLAEHGFIEELPGKGTRRERWWRRVGIAVRYAEAMEAGDEQAAATTEFMTLTLRRDLARAVAFLRQDWTFDWRYAAIFNKYTELYLDPAGLDQLRTELWELLSRYTARPSTSPEAQRVVFTMQGFPYRPGDPADIDPDPVTS